MKIGSHMDMKAPDYLLGAIQKTIENEATALMVYTGAPQNTVRKSVSTFHIPEAHSLMQEAGIPLENMIIHAPYIINLANTEKKETYDLAVQVLRSEIERTSQMGAKYLVLHPGSCLKATREEGIASIAKGLNEVIQKDCPVTVLLETMAGKGSEIGREFQELAKIISLVNYPEHIGICMDTCHMHDAGYDMHDFDGVLEEFEKYISLDRVKVIHVNDSKNVQGAHKDRHANIGNGEIGFEALCKIVHHERLQEVVKILETPYINDLAPYKAEIAMLRQKEYHPEWLEEL
ncbi:MAG: deoxyribonuclease IV [Erysipelotrichales bacterium]|nr:deoxyribonuclease IV [Erysipelotrichales bacterium]